MSNAANLKPVFIPAQPVENPARRKMLVAATTGAHLELRVGAIASLTAVDLCDLLERVRLAHPNLSVSIVQEATDEMVRDVRDGRLDLAIVDTARPSGRNLESLVVCEESFSLVGPALPSGPVAPADLDGRTWVALRCGTRLREVFDRLMEDHHLVPAVIGQVGDIRLLGRLSAAGFGNAVLPAPMTRRQRAAPIPAAVLAPRIVRAVYAPYHCNPALATCLTILHDGAGSAG